MGSRREALGLGHGDEVTQLSELHPIRIRYRKYKFNVLEV
jgi:hypothetical protein